MKQRLLELIEKFSQGSVLVVGDLVLDEMTYGVTERISREAPVLILSHDHTNIVLGAAGNAAHNVAKLGAKTGVAGVAGKDYYCTHLVDALEKAGITEEGLVHDESRPTSTKTRISGIANHSVTQQIVRIDRESSEPVSGDVEKALLDKITQLLPQFDAVILSDYALGVLTDAVIDHTMALAKKHGKIIAVDSQQELARFKGVTVLTPNQPEAESNVGFKLNTFEDVEKAGAELLRQTEADNILITLGGRGMAIFARDKEMVHVPVFNHSEVFDVTGAGDTVIGTLTLALTVGADIVEAAVLGNLAASIVVRRFGAATTNPPELLKAMNKLSDNHLDGLTQPSSV